MSAIVGKKIESRLRAEADEEQIQILSRFFKTGPGEYGEGDRFHGVRVPRVRQIVKEYRKDVELDDVRHLLNSCFHEERLAGFLSLIEIYKRIKKSKRKEDIRAVVDFYLSVLDAGNNWDLVDLVAPKILGDWIAGHEDESPLLYDLAGMEDSLWHQRVAMVSTWTIICHGRYTEALTLAEMFLNHKHDLMHKASGWMLREVGKRGGMDLLLEFLDKYSAVMPRTMLRYSIEKLSADKRQHYMSQAKRCAAAKSLPRH